ncbi:MAG: cobaltochelatase subunit CobN, partial [Pelistega sp.]|nr:cobaltochelatase subunit CobN [Pelistega sp.]
MMSLLKKALGAFFHALLLLLSLQSYAYAQVKVLIISTPFNHAEQYVKLQTLAQETGLSLDFAYVRAPTLQGKSASQSSASQSSARQGVTSATKQDLMHKLAQADLIILDGPRPSDWELLQEEVVPLLAQHSTPWLHIQTRSGTKQDSSLQARQPHTSSHQERQKPTQAQLATQEQVLTEIAIQQHASSNQAPQRQANSTQAIEPSSLAESGLTSEQAHTIRAYYENGTKMNWLGLFHYLQAVINHTSTAEIAAPVVFGGHGFYHPEAAQPFSDYASYLTYLEQREHWGNTRIGFIIHKGMLASMQTSVIDYIIHAAELMGIQAIVFWKERHDPADTAQFLASLELQALVNMTHLQGQDMASLFEALGIPVVQTFSFTATEQHTWEQATSGITPQQASTFLALPETWGLIEPTVISEKLIDKIRPLEAQIDRLLMRLRALTALQTTPNSQKKLALMFWNHPDNNKSISASGLNVPKSLELLLQALKTADYQVEAISEVALISTLQELLKAQHQPNLLPALLAQGLADTYPVADYQYWFKQLPQSLQASIVHELGPVEQDETVFQIDGRAVFIIPRLQLKNLNILPLARRGNGSMHDYHDKHSAPSHHYMASYLYLQSQAHVDALIHFGTHGTQEWLPGKDRGLSVYDYPHLVLQNLPVFYPYIQDNVGEAMQAKRRGRATMISHHTPIFSPSGLHDALKTLHEHMHAYEQLEKGPVQEQAMVAIKDQVQELHLDKELGTDAAMMDTDFEGFFTLLHHHLHTLAARSIPLGLHSLGHDPDQHLLTLTVMQQLGQAWVEALGSDYAELMAQDAQAIQASLPYQVLYQHLIGQEGIDKSSSTSKTGSIKSTALTANAGNAG